MCRGTGKASSVAMEVTREAAHSLVHSWTQQELSPYLCGGQPADSRLLQSRGAGRISQVLSQLLVGAEGSQQV